MAPNQRHSSGGSNTTGVRKRLGRGRDGWGRVKGEGRTALGRRRRCSGASTSHRVASAWNKQARTPTWTLSRSPSQSVINPNLQSQPLIPKSISWTMSIYAVPYNNAVHGYIVITSWKTIKLMRYGFELESLHDVCFSRRFIYTAMLLYLFIEMKSVDMLIISVSYFKHILDIPKCLYAIPA